MSSQTASCSCGRLRIQVEGEPRGVGICHCLACQQRTGSVFATLASLSSVQSLRPGHRICPGRDQGARFTFRFCPTCGTTVFHTEEGNDASVSVAVGGRLPTLAFRRLDFPSTNAANIRGFSCRHAP